MLYYILNIFYFYNCFKKISDKRDKVPQSRINTGFLCHFLCHGFLLLSQKSVTTYSVKLIFISILCFVTLVTKIRDKLSDRLIMYNKVVALYCKFSIIT